MSINDKIFSSPGDIQTPLEIESLCMKCNENGITRLLLIDIPFFREIVVSAFCCSSCNWSNNEVQQVSQIQEYGCKISLKLTSKEDMNRSLVKMETATFRIEELDFEIPPQTQPGLFTTIEGILSRAIEGLKQNQPIRKYQDTSKYEAINKIIIKLENIKQNNENVTIILDDPTGNSYIQNLKAPIKDPNMKISYYNRTKEQNELLGFKNKDTLENSEILNTKKEKIYILKNKEHVKIVEKIKEKEIKSNKSDDNDDKLDNKVVSILINCPSCNIEGNMKMHMLDIPHFKEIVIMAFNCENCGLRSNEVKACGNISKTGKKHILKVETVQDLNRDILISETCSIFVPELELEVISRSIGGRFTTVEGLLMNIRDNLDKSSFCKGDSSTIEERELVKQFFIKFKKLLELQNTFTLILDDPMSNSYLQNIYNPDTDPNLQVIDYIRTKEQNEELGLNQIKTENYKHDELL